MRAKPPHPRRVFMQQRPRPPGTGRRARCRPLVLPAQRGPAEHPRVHAAQHRTLAPVGVHAQLDVHVDALATVRP